MKNPPMSLMRTSPYYDPEYLQIVAEAQFAMQNANQSDFRRLRLNHSTVKVLNEVRIVIRDIIGVAVGIYAFTDIDSTHPDAVLINAGSIALSMTIDNIICNFRIEARLHKLNKQQHDKTN